MKNPKVVSINTGMNEKHVEAMLDMIRSEIEKRGALSCTVIIESPESIAPYHFGPAGSARVYKDIVYNLTMAMNVVSNPPDPEDKVS